MEGLQTIEVPISGMDCAECTEHVRRAISGLPGVVSVEVLLAAEKATIRLDPLQVGLDDVRRAVQAAGYDVSAAHTGPSGARSPARVAGGDVARQASALLAVLFGVVLFVVVGGELLGLFERITSRVPWPVGLAIVLAAGFPVFLNVIRAAWRGQILSHTLMTLGVIAALAVGEWATAVVVVFFMRVGDFVERFTSERARQSLKRLTALAPQTARVLRAGQELEVPVATVQPGEAVVVRPGEQIPVDGDVLGGRATVDQATITGEPMPVEVGPGSRVYAATYARGGALRVRASQVGNDTTFGRVVRLVEEAEGNRATVQRAADRFSRYYLPVVAGIAALTFALGRDPLATAAVLVVACSCSFALATPIAVLASIGAGARRGLLIKGGRYLEALARADVLLVDKTGTLTLGRPKITDVVGCEPGNADSATDRSVVLHLAASAERYSEHPLASAVRAAARSRGLELAEPAEFTSQPGVGVRAVVNGRIIEVGSERLAAAMNAAVHGDLADRARDLERQGKTLLYVAVDGRLAGILAASDTLRPEVPAALAAVRRLGIAHVELLTGDNKRAAQALASELGVAHRAGLLPEDKIRIVQEHQAQGHTVVMVGDGVNDAPALAQADVGVAMAASGSDVAIEAAHVALMRDDWAMVPELLAIARRTMRIVHLNLGFTVLYNVVGLALAALGFLPPVLAAAAQSLPDLGILANSSRLLRQRARPAAQQRARRALSGGIEVSHG